MNIFSTSARARLVIAGLLATGIGFTADPAGAVSGSASASATPRADTCASYRADYAYPVQLCGRGEAVRLAQAALRSAGFDIDADGYFGPHTREALLAFQSQHGLAASGEIDEASWVALTGGTVAGDDADGSGIVDPWEAGGTPPAPLPPQGGDESGAWAVVLAVSTWWDDPALWSAAETASWLGYDGIGPACNNGAAATFGYPASTTLTYYSVTLTFDSRAVADEARAGLAARGIDSRVGYVQFACGR